MSESENALVYCRILRPPGLAYHEAIQAELDRQESECCIYAESHGYVVGRVLRDEWGFGGLYMTLLPDGKSGPVGLTAVAMTTEDNDYAALVVEDPAVLGQRAEDAGAVVNWAQSVDMEILCLTLRRG